jgi:hypothetical protein
MATKGPLPELSSKLIYQEWFADGLRKQKMEKFIFFLSFPSFLSCFDSWVLKVAHLFPLPKIVLNMPFFFLSQICCLTHRSPCLMKWRIGIELAHSSSLGGSPHMSHIGKSGRVMLCPWRGHSGTSTSLVCWRGSMTLSFHCLERIIIKIEKLSCQAVSGLRVVLMNK